LGLEKTRSIKYRSIFSLEKSNLKDTDLFLCLEKSDLFSV